MPEATYSVYRDATHPVETRVDDLLAQMTLDEKLAQIGCVWVTDLLDGQTFSEAKAVAKLQNGTGHITRIGAATGLYPDDNARIANSIQKFLIEHTRLGIPAIVHEESCAGYTARSATCFPQSIGLASTWQPELIEAMTDVIRTQMRAVGAHHALAPVIDVARDPRWGRTEETYGEDPYLVAALGTAYVRGLQTENLAEGIAATGKHFVGYALSEGGMNWAPAHIPIRELLDVFVFPFAAAIKEAHLASIMNAYHELDGVPCGSSRYLLTELLRDVLGFKGAVVSDYFTVATLMSYHHIAGDKGAAAKAALEAGLDVELPALDCYGEPLKQAVERGDVDIALIDTAARRLLRMKFELGLFERSYVDVGHVLEVFDTPEQRALARQIARQSFVLLKNDGDLLPLDKTLKTIAVIGPSADNTRLQQGDYHYPAHVEVMYEQIGFTDAPVPPFGPTVESLADHFVPMISILDGIKAAVSPQTQILYAEGCDITDDSKAGFQEALNTAQKADVAVVAVGGRSGLVRGCTSGESIDQAEPRLTGVQQELIEAIYATGTPTVVVLLTGKPLIIPWLAEHIPAILEAWIPGEEGGSALADVLFGDYTPGGKLPMSFPRDAGQILVYYNHKPSGGRSHWKGDYADLSPAPLYPFGHGLSYTQFEYSNLQISAAQVVPDDMINVSLDITNTGKRTGDEVVQLYLHDVVGSVTRPVKELKGFKRITLAPGEKRRLTFDLAVAQTAFTGVDMRLIVEPGVIEVMIGSSSQDIRLTGRFQITGEVTEISPKTRPFFSRVSIQPVQ